MEIEFINSISSKTRLFGDKFNMISSV
jgi:hypothetical protein